MVRHGFRVPALLILIAAMVCGCGGVGSGPESAKPALIPAGLQGVVHGGQQPVNGATVQLYSVGTGGDGSAAMPLLTPAVMTGPDGGFTLTGLYTVSFGDGAGVSGGDGRQSRREREQSQPGADGRAGPCGNLTGNTYIVINELTTVGAVYPLAPFIPSPPAIGSATGDAWWA